MMHCSRPVSLKKKATVNDYYNMLYAAGYKPEDKSSILAMLITGGLSKEEAETIYNAYADREYINTQIPNDGWGPGLKNWESFIGVLRGPIIAGGYEYVNEMLEKWGAQMSKEQWSELQNFMESVGFDPSGLSWLD